MSKILLLTYISLVFALTGCATISENKAEQLIIEEYSNQIGEATIISTEKVDNEYLIKQENEASKYRGISKVSVVGEITMIEAEIE